MNQKEFISNKQGIALVALLILGEASIFVQGIMAKSDLWLAFLLGALAAVPVILMFARLHVLFPEKNLFDMMEICFGKYFGKFLVLIFTWYCFHAISLVLEDWGFFVRTVVFPETPNLAVIIPFTVACAYVAKQGIEVLGRWGEFFLIVPILLVIVVFLLVIPKMEWSYLTPVLYEGWKPVIKGAFLTWGFPLTYTVAFTMLFSLTKGKNSPYKIYMGGFLIGTTVLFLIYMGVILVLGPFNASNIYYPTYKTVAMISIGSFLQRLDIVAAIIYMIGIFVQTSAFLLGACKGFAKLFAFKDYRFIVWPMAFLAVTLAAYEPESVMHYFEFGIDVWPYYILPFELFLPLLIWIVAEIRVRKARKRNQVLGQ